MIPSHSFSFFFIHLNCRLEVPTGRLRAGFPASARKTRKKSFEKASNVEYKCLYGRLENSGVTKAEQYEEVPLSPDQKRIDTFKGRRFWLLAGKQVAGVAGVAGSRYSRCSSSA